MEDSSPTLYDEERELTCPLPAPATQALLTPSSSAAIKLERDIFIGGKNPVTVIETGLRHGDLDLETVWTCLEGYKNKHLRHLDRSQAVTQIQKDRIGGLCLDWLWKDNDRWSHVLAHESLFFDALSYYLVAEGLQDYLLNIIKLEHAPAESIHPAWRGVVLRCLIRAMLDVATDESADRAIEVLEKINDEVVPLRAHDGLRVHMDTYASTSLQPASIELLRRLSRGEHRRTSQHKFRQLLSMAQRVMGRGKSADLALARLALMIPNAPNPEPLLTVLRKWRASKAESELPLAHEGTRRAVYLSACRLEDVLRDQSRHEEARWVSGVCERLFARADQRSLDYGKLAEEQHDGSRGKQVYGTSERQVFRKLIIGGKRSTANPPNGWS